MALSSPLRTRKKQSRGLSSSLLPKEALLNTISSFLDPPMVARMPMLLVEIFLCTTALAGVCYGRLLVKMTLVAGANKLGAGTVCLDGSLPAYHFDRGQGSGDNNWILQFEGGGWCGDIVSCMERSKTRRGSTRYMNKLEVFSGILSNNRTENPDFYNWNRVKLRYCDGASFGGDSVFSNGTSSIYFRGQRIWKAIILDLLPKGLNVTRKVLLSGCSAGGLATFLHCDDLAKFLPKNATLKCMSDAGFFLNVRDISGSNMIWPFFDTVVTLHGVGPILNRNCTYYFKYPSLCFFPQNALDFIRTPYFILNSAYDIYQFHHIFVPPSSDPYKLWSRCQLHLTDCNLVQLAILQVYRYKMLGTLRQFEEGSRTGGLYINSCFAHCQSELQDTWFGANSPRINNKTIAEAVGDWYFSRKVSKEIDCPYPCDNTCVDAVTL